MSTSYGNAKLFKLIDLLMELLKMSMKLMQCDVSIDCLLYQ